MKHILFLILTFVCTDALSQIGTSLIFPDSMGWNTLNENEELRFMVKTTHTVPANFSIQGVGGLNIEFDSLGNFRWKPSYELVDRLEKTKVFSVIFQLSLPDGKRERQEVSFTINHVNRPPVIEDLPIVYVKQSSLSTYQIQSELVFDPDSDPLVFKSIQSQMPEGSSISSSGQFTWTPSRTQFAGLKNNPLTLEFVVQDQPYKAETIGKLRIAQTQQDLPPEIMVVPGDTLFTIKEDEILNLKLYLSDPNGDDNVQNFGFIPSDKRIPQNALKENTPLQYEFTWSPGYNFVDDTQTFLTPEIVFFSLDKSNNRTQRKVRIKVADTENLVKKDAHQYQKYRSNLVEAMILVQQLDANQKTLNNDYKKAKKGKKNRSIVNASLGALTGFTPIIIDNPDDAKVVAGIGGTTVLTFGTLEATEVIGRSKEAILEKIKISIDIRNKVQAAGDEFARKYALKLPRRNAEFEKDIEKFRNVLNDQRIVLLELDAYAKNVSKIEDKDIKKVFVDFTEEQK